MGVLELNHKVIVQTHYPRSLDRYGSYPLLLGSVVPNYERVSRYNL